MATISNIKMTLRYLKHGEERTASLTDKEGRDLGFRVVQKDGRLKITLEPYEEIELLSAQLELPLTYLPHNTVFLNGYQSWTDSREHGLKDPIPKDSVLFAELKKHFAMDRSGDYSFVPFLKDERLYSFSYTYVREHQNFRLFGSLSEREGFSIFVHRPDQNTLQIKKDVAGKSVCDLYVLFDIFECEGEYDQVFDQYFAKMNLKPRTDKRLVGYTSWYNHYQNINETVIFENLEAISKLKDVRYDIFQIDDGYQTAVGDWLSVDPAKFPLGMAHVADEIHKKGMLAGIWLAPLTAEKKSMLVKENPQWFLQNEDGKLQSAGMNWSGMLTLDTENPEVRAHLAQVFRVIFEDWGYDLVKLDFLYSACILPRNNKTRGQLMQENMEFLRGLCGDKLMLGCGVPLYSAFGIADYCRIGADVSLSWDGAPIERLLHRERVSTKNAIYNALYRRHLNGRAFGNDPDVFLLRAEKTSLNAEQKSILGRVAHLTGSVLFNSDNVSSYGAEQLAELKNITQKDNCSLKRVYEPVKGTLNVEYQQDGQDKILSINMQKGKKLL